MQNVASSIIFSKFLNIVFNPLLDSRFVTVNDSGTFNEETYDHDEAKDSQNDKDHTPDRII